MATTAPPNVGGGTITGVKADNATNQLQKKRRNRSKKKRGKGGVVGVGDGGGGGAAAQGSPTADAGFATRQKQKQKNPPPTEQRQKKHLQQQQQPQPRQRDRGQQHRNKKDNPRTAVQRPTQASLTGPPQPNVQPSTAVTGFKRAPAPVFDIIDPKGAGGQHHEVAMDTSNVGDARRFGQVSRSSSVATGTSTPRFKKCTETGEAADRSIRHDNLVASKGAPVTNEIAPFECSWTAVLNADDKVDDGMRPTGEEDGTNSSERSFQSFQEGELSGLGAQPDGSKGHPSNTVSPQLQIADQQPASGGRRQTGQNDEQVESTATQNESTSAHVPSQCSVDVGRSLVGVEDRDGASTEMKAGGSGEMDSMLKSGPTMVQRAVADATTCRQPAVDEQSNPGDPRKRISEAENQRRQVELEQETGSLPNTKPQPQAIAQGIVLKPPVDCKTHLGSQSTEDAPTHPSHEVPAEPRRVCTAVDEHGEDHSGSGGASAADNGADNADDEDEEDALLLPGASTSQGSQIEQGHGGAGHGSGFSLLKDSETTVLQTAVERAAEELLVDDIDDESTTLLERSPVTTARCPKSKPPLASTSATTGAVAAEAEASAKDPPVLSSASSSAGGMAAKDTPSLPAATPPPASTAPTSTAVAAATNFNYYELPVVPEHAPEATGQRADRGTRSTDPSTGNIRQPTLSRTRPAEEHKDLSGMWAAVRRSDTAGVRAQLAGGATLDEADSEGRTPLMVACAAGDKEMVSLLVKGVSPPSSVAARTIEGWTPLMIASGGGRLGVVKLLLEAGAAIHDKDDEFGSNSFMWACGGGHSEVVRLMLDHGAKELLQSVNSDMWTPLMVACDAGSLATVQVLVEAGADLGAFNRDILTAMDIAADRNHLLVEGYLRTEGASSSGQFWNAADTGNANMISKLLRGNGHLVAALDDDGRTALLRSCVGGHLEAARVLVEAGADVDFQDSSGTSALSVSAVLGDVNLARYLVQTGGARLTVKNKAGWTPLMQAVAKGDLIMTRYLVDRGAAVNDGNPGGESVLDMAKRFSGAELQRYLAAKGGFSSHEVKRQIGEVNHGGRGLFRFW